MNDLKISGTGQLPQIFLSIKYYEDLRNRDWIDSFTSELSASGCDVRCVIRDIEAWGEKSFSPEQLMKATFGLIRSCDWLIVDLAEKGVGLGIEAGYAAAFDIPIIAMLPCDTDLSTTIRGIANQVIRYQNCSDAADQVRQVVTARKE